MGLKNTKRIFLYPFLSVSPRPPSVPFLILLETGLVFLPLEQHLCLKSWSLRTKTYWDLRHIKKEWYRYAIYVHFKAYFRNMLQQWKWCRHLTALRQGGNAGYGALETLYNFSPVLKCGKCKLVWSINGDNLLEIACFIGISWLGMSLLSSFSLTPIWSFWRVFFPPWLGCALITGWEGDYSGPGEDSDSGSGEDFPETRFLRIPILHYELSHLNSQTL